MNVYRGRFENKTAIVTGAAQGIGYATAERLGREGARIVVADAAEKPARQAVKSLSKLGIEAVAAIADLSTHAGAETVMKLAAKKFGSVQVLVNNVGGAVRMKPFWHFSADEIELEVQRSLWPTLWCTRAVIPLMRESGGAIVNLGSNAVDGPYRVPYSASKGAVVALTTSLAIELADLDIRINCVSPGGTTAPPRKTPRNSQPLSAAEQQWSQQFVQLAQNEDLLGRVATLDEQAAVICFLASDDAAHITGEVINTGRRGTRPSKLLGFVP